MRWVTAGVIMRRTAVFGIRMTGVSFGIGSSFGDLRRMMGMVCSGRRRCVCVCLKCCLSCFVRGFSSVLSEELSKELSEELSEDLSEDLSEELSEELH